MKKLIEILDANLKTKRPDYYSKLNPGLTDEKIKQLEEKYHFVLPDELKELYKWKNGQQENCYSSLINNSMFLSLESAFSSKEILDGMIGSDFEIVNWWNENWFPIFDNGGGDHICYDAKGIFTGESGQIIEFWHADHDRNVIFPNFVSLMEAISHFYDSTPIEKFTKDLFYEVQSPEGYPKRFEVK